MTRFLFRARLPPALMIWFTVGILQSAYIDACFSEACKRFSPVHTGWADENHSKAT